MMANTDTSTSANTPEVGLVTWESEGMEGGPYHSRVLHVPGESSGLTIGRGYDMKERTTAGIVQDLSACGVSAADAATIAKAAGLAGSAARKFIQDNQLGKFEISPSGQKALFLISYARIKSDVERICAKPDVVAAYGACDWTKIDQAIVDILVDLRFRGDYNGTSRALLQKLVSGNDLTGLTKAMKNVANWPNVPKDRFQRRCAFLDRALAAKPAA
jgi:hypothetical protein